MDDYVIMVNFSVTHTRCCREAVENRLKSVIGFAPATSNRCSAYPRIAMIHMVCLTPEEISDYLQGRLNDDQCDSVEQHLSRCETCETLAKQMDASGDSLMRHLRLSPDSPVTDEDWQSCLESLRQLPRNVDESVSPAENLSLDKVLRPESVYHYQLDRQLGRGGMGVVYKSRHPQLHRPVAIKILSASRATDAQSIARFQREMRAAGGLDHPGIVRALDAGIWQGTYYLVMEYIDGIDLSRLAHRSGPLAVADACELIRQAAEAIQFAHEHQVIHRDVKPSNLMLARDGGVKILDFGLARLEHGGLTSHDATTAGRLIGTLDYLAPEQAAGGQMIDARSDVYGLGATLYRLLAGRPPHGSSRNRPILDYLHELTHETAVEIETYRQDLPGELCRMIADTLSLDPQLRPPTAASVAEALRPFAEGSDLCTLALESAEESDIDADSSTASVDVNSLSDSVDPSSSPRQVRQPANERPARNGLLRRWVVATAWLIAGLVGGLAGVTLWLQTGEATIEIWSEVDDVTVELVKDDKIADEIEVHPGENVSRIRVGKYEIRIAGTTDNVRVDQSRLSLMRGDKRIVRIIRDAAVPEGDPLILKGLDPAESVRRHVQNEQDIIDALRKELGDDHPAVTAKMDALTETKRKIVGLALGDDPAAPTSKGRTYRQWTDVVLRETDPSTIVDAIESLEALNTPETNAQTYETLIRIAQRNESTASTEVCDDYIRYLTTPKNDDDQPQQDRSSRRDDNWERFYPSADKDRLNVVDAILSALSKLPDDARAPTRQVLQSSNETAKFMTLLEIAKKRDEETAESSIDLVASFCRDDQSPAVRALANHIWLVNLRQNADEPQKRALASESIPLAKAVLASLLIQDQCPFGREMGSACGRLVLAGEGAFGMSVRRIAMQAIQQGDAFGLTEESQFLHSTGAELVRQLEVHPPSQTGSLTAIQMLEMLASIDQISDVTRKSASKFLHGYLEEQLQARQRNDDPGTFDEDTEFVLYTVQALSAVDGALPNELLDQYAMQQDSKQANAFNEWADAFRANSPDADRDMSLYLVQFPLETLAVVFDVAAETIRPETGDRSITMRGLDQIGLAIAIPYAAQHLDNKNVQMALGAILNTQAQRGLDDVQLNAPIRQYATSLVDMARGLAIGTARGIALRMAQLGGADETLIQQQAIQWIAADRDLKSDKQRRETQANELAWLVECLAAAQPMNLSDEQIEMVVDRLLASTFSHVSNNPTDLERCFIAVLKLSRPGASPDPRLIKAGLGMRVDGFRPNLQRARSGQSRRVTSIEDQQWRWIVGGVPETIVRETLQTLVKYPLADEQIYARLQEMHQRASVASGFRGESPDRGESPELLSEAIVAVEKAIANALDE